MTVSTSAARVVHNGNGTTIEFAVPFRFLENSHVAVFLRDAAGGQTQWMENTQYTLAGADEAAGGTLTVITAPTDYTPASGEKLVAVRSVPITQETDYVENDPFPAETHERALDKLTMVNQEQTERLDRTFTIPETDTAAGNFVLPGDVDRANRFLAFDGLGNPVVAVGTSGDLNPVSDFMDSLLSAADAASARTQLGAQRDLLAILTADGDLPLRAAGAIARLAAGTDGQFIRMVSGAPAWADRGELASISDAPPEMALNVTTPADQLDIAAGTVRAEDAAANIVLPATTIDISTSGDGGRLGTTARVADTPYHILAGRRTSDGVYVAGFSDTYAKPAGWDNFRRIGGWRTKVASTELEVISQRGDEFLLETPILFSVNNPGTGPKTQALAVVTGLSVDALISAGITATTVVTYLHVSPLDVAQQTPSASVSTGTSAANNVGTSAHQNTPMTIRTNTTGQVRYEVFASNASVVVRLATRGWRDRRGRDLSPVLA